MAVIFDLDLTLIDSTCVAELRRARRWPEVYAAIPRCVPYHGVSTLLLALHEAEIPVGIVTSSPRPYFARIADYHRWRPDASVCYHDTRRHKPHPEPFHMALARLGVHASAAVAIGDTADDVAAARSAGIFAVAAAWGALDRGALRRACPDIWFETVADLQQWLCTSDD